jgi:two-component sensor histidine kinase
VSAFVASLKWPPDIILSDYSMPQFSAKAALRLLEEHAVDIPLIVVTGSISEEIAVEMIMSGASDYLIKDRLTRLGQAVRAAMEKKRLRDQERKSVDALREYAESQRLLLLELDHRVRNNLTALLGLIDLSRGTTQDVHTFTNAFGARVRAMATAHSLLSHAQWRAVDFRRLVFAMAVPGASGRIEAIGPDVEIPPQQATALGMVISELFTNSIKHGSLSVASGSLHIGWTLSDARTPGGQLKIRWIERGGPPISNPPPSRAGTQILEGLIKSELRGGLSLSYPTDGAQHTIIVSLSPAETPVPSPNNEPVGLPV